MAENISTVNKTAADYATLVLWEDDTDYDLVTAKTSETADTYKDGGALTGSLIIAGATTNGTYKRKISAASTSKHSGTRGTGVVIKPTTSSVNEGIKISEGNFSLDGVEVDGSAITGRAYAFGVLAEGISTVVKNCIIYDVSGSTEGVNLDLRSSAQYCVLWNNIILNSDVGFNISLANNEIYSNTLINHVIGVRVNGIRYLKAKNNVSLECSTACFDGSFDGTANYNAASDTSAPGDDSLQEVTSANQVDSVTAGSEDAEIKLGADIIGAGADLGASYNVDIIGTARPQGAAWDIGAFEYVSAVSTIKRRLLMGVGA